MSSGFADGIIATPFSTPRIAEDRHPNAATLADDMQDLSSTFVFDPMTHARLLPSTNKLEFYDQWDLWPTGDMDLSKVSTRTAHVERVFQVQASLQAPSLAPTVQLSTPVSSEATIALDIGRIASGLAPGTWQSLVGTRQFWASGPDLDGYVGSLATLRAKVWVVTVANEVVIDSEPDLTDVAAFVGLCRTVRSLSRRSRVIVGYSDYAGLPAVAAGADTVGTGWHRAQKTFDPKASSFHIDSDPGIRRQAEYVTQGNIHAILRRDTADQIVKWNSAQADVIRGGPLPPSANLERMHHLNQLQKVVHDINACNPGRDRYVALRDRYAVADTHFNALISGVPAVRRHDKEVWRDAMSDVLEAYAAGEGF
ncbi:hypothetical protein BKG84_05490 [Mycobacteroides chelonae]|uniref:Uncharacterized protein n=1 Tax=Mycobacteroides chelonae TaxID=1774 RepID=A0A1S1M3C7_MYCCH|nr:hypothetical protein BKG84_05490 [Mycobacteroides chelonae]